MGNDNMLFLTILLYQFPNGVYGVYGQGINADTGQMELEHLGTHERLNTALEHAELAAAESDCILVETLKGSRQIARDVNEEVG